MNMNCHIRVRAGALIIRDQAVLLSEFGGRYGRHYLLPGGGVEPGESVVEALQRELREEASVEIDAGPIALVYEHVPRRLPVEDKSDVHTLHLILACTIAGDAEPRLSAHPDPNQTGIKWVPLAELGAALRPGLGDRILAYVRNGRNIDLIGDRERDPEARSGLPIDNRFCR